MIIVKLSGGLGNQLFQYACARALAEKHQTQLYLDTGIFKVYKLHKYSLAPFKIIQEKAGPKELKRFVPPNKILKGYFKAVDAFFPYYRRRVVKEPFYHFDSHVLALPDNVYLDGYWQSEKYFCESKKTILSEVVVKEPQTGRNLEIARKILSTESVCIHIRRGDYVKDSQTNEIHGTCQLDYYDVAIQRIASQVARPHFFIFSDDPVWVKEHLKMNHPATFVDHNDAGKNFEDLRLMSQCKYFIIANSSFSWWGAWLSVFPGKIVFAPKNWFKTSEFNTKDLYPPDWIKL